MAAEAPTLFIQRVARLDAAAADIDAWRRADIPTCREGSATGDVGSAGDFDSYTAATRTATAAAAATMAAIATTSTTIAAPVAACPHFTQLTTRQLSSDW